MNYFQEIDAWFTAVIFGGEDTESAEEWFERVKKDVKEKILESYRNGQKAGLPSPKPANTGKDAPRATHGTNRETQKRKFWPPRRHAGPRDE